MSLTILITEMRKKAMARQREEAERQAAEPGQQNNVAEIKERLREVQQELQVAAENGNRIIVNFLESFQ